MNHDYEFSSDFKSRIEDDLRSLRESAMSRDYADKMIKANGVIDFNTRIMTYLRHHIEDPTESVKFAKIIFENIMDYLSGKFNLLSIGQRQEIGFKCASLLNKFNLTDGISPVPIIHRSEIYVNLSHPSDILNLRPNHYYLLHFHSTDDKCRIFDLGTNDWSTIRFSNPLKANENETCVVIRTLPNTCGKSILIDLNLSPKEINDTVRLNSSDVSSAVLVMSLNRTDSPIEEDIIVQNVINRYLGFQAILIPLDATRLNILTTESEDVAIGIFQLILGSYFHDIPVVSQLEPACTDTLRTLEGTKVFRTPDDMSYDVIINTINELISLPGVQGEIYITLYRVADNSRIIDALLKASNFSFRINVYIELDARGDEIRNLNMLKILQGYKNIRVYTGSIGMKVHGKIFAISYKAYPGLMTSWNYFTHISTGNYNEKNAKTYRDMQLVSTEVPYFQEAVEFFKGIKKKKFSCTIGLNDKYPVTFKSSILPINGYSQVNKVKHTILENIKKVSLQAINMGAERPGKCRIILKCNHLRDDDIEMQLVNALMSGVNVDLIVRTTFDPTFIQDHYKKPHTSPYKGFYGVLKVHQPVGEFLEHDRIYAFIANHSSDVYLSSADLMYRNLYNRAEMIIRVGSDGCHSIQGDIIDMLNEYCYDIITNDEGLNYSSKLKSEITHRTYFD